MLTPKKPQQQKLRRVKKVAKQEEKKKAEPTHTKNIDKAVDNFVKNFEKENKELCDKRNSEYLEQKDACEAQGGLWSCFLLPSCMSKVENYELTILLSKMLGANNLKDQYLKDKTKVYCQMIYGNDHCLMERKDIVKSFQCKQHGASKIWSPRYKFCSNKNERKMFQETMIPCLIKEGEEKQICLDNLDLMVKNLHKDKNRK